MRRTGMMAVVLLFACGIFFAAGQEEAVSTGEKTQVTVARWVDGPVSEDSYAEKYIEELFPEIDFIPVPLQRATSEEQMNIKVAGGDVPDVMWRTSNAGVREYVNQGILAEVPYDSLRQYAPELFKAMKNFGTEVFLSTYVEGKNYGVPYVNETQTFPFTDGMRSDWLSAVGISELPETVDDLEEAFKRFTLNDPDGNGVDDTYGFSMRAKDAMELTFPNLWGAFNVLPGGWMKQADGSVKYGATTDEFRDALRVLNSWYDLGYMDPEFITTDWALLKEKWNNGKIGYIPCSTWYRLMPTGENWDQLLAVDPSAEITMVPAVKGPSGSYGYLGWGKATGSYAFGIHLEKTPDLMNKLIQVIETVSSDPVHHGHLTYGKENVHWSRNSDGAAEFIAPYNESQKRGELGTFFSFLSLPPMDVQKTYWRSDYDDLTKYARDRNFLPEEQYTWLVQLTDESNQALQDVKPVYREWMVKFIAGEKDVDADWAEYMAVMEEMGFAAINADASSYYAGVAETLAFIESQTR